MYDDFEPQEQPLKAHARTKRAQHGSRDVCPGPHGRIRPAAPVQCAGLTGRWHRSAADRSIAARRTLERETKQIDGDSKRSRLYFISVESPEVKRRKATCNF